MARELQRSVTFRECEMARELQRPVMHQEEMARELQRPVMHQEEEENEPATMIRHERRLHGLHIHENYVRSYGLTILCAISIYLSMTSECFLHILNPRQF